MSEIRVDTIKAEDGISAPSFPSGVSVTGVITATSLQQSVSGEFTAGSLKVGNNIQVGNAGIITATNFIGSGANLTGITQAVKKIYTRRDGDRHSVNNQVQDNNYSNMWNWSNMQQVITPQSATSQFHITGSLNISHYGSYEGYVTIAYVVGGTTNVITSDSQSGFRRTHRGNLASDTGSTMMGPVPLDLMVAPATTNAVTFQIRLSTSASGYPWHVNRDGSNTTNTSDGGGVLSSWTITELDGAQVTTLNSGLHIGT